MFTHILQERPLAIQQWHDSHMPGKSILEIMSKSVNTWVQEYNNSQQNTTKQMKPCT